MLRRHLVEHSKNCLGTGEGKKSGGDIGGKEASGVKCRGGGGEVKRGRNRGIILFRGVNI